MDQALISQRTLAAELQLSPATVSKSLRNHPGINAQTRARVMHAAAAHGYRLQYRKGGTLSHDLRDVRPDTVGVLLSSHTGLGRDLPGMGFLTGLSEQANAADMSLVVHRFDGDSRQLLEPDGQPTALRNSQLKGLVLVHQFDREVVEHFAARMPVVTLIRDVPGVVKDHVDVNHASAMLSLLSHLHELGHRRIGFVGRSPQLAYSNARFGSFVQAAASLGMNWKPSWMIRAFAEISPSSVVLDGVVADEAFRCVKEEHVTAFVCASDGVGYRLAAELMDRGLRIPHDVSLVGFDGMEPTPGVARLTSVMTPFEQIGRAGFTMLRERMADASLPPRSLLIDCRVVKGLSTSAPAST